MTLSVSKCIIRLTQIFIKKRKWKWNELCRYKHKKKEEKKKMAERSFPFILYCWINGEVLIWLIVNFFFNWGRSLKNFFIGQSIRKNEDEFVTTLPRFSVNQSINQSFRFFLNHFRLSKREKSSLRPPSRILNSIDRSFSIFFIVFIEVGSVPLSPAPPRRLAPRLIWGTFVSCRWTFKRKDDDNLLNWIRMKSVSL